MKKHSKVRVHIPGQPTIDGLLIRCRKDWLELYDCTVLQSAEADPEALAGSVFIPRSKIFAVQVLS